MSDPTQERDPIAWQTGVWNRRSEGYVREIDQRLAPVVDALIARSGVRTGGHGIDLGPGRAAAAPRAAAIVGPSGRVVGVDISPDMLSLARQALFGRGLDNVTLLEGRAEAIPASDAEFDAVLASLSLMFVIRRDAAAREIARVLKPGG